MKNHKIKEILHTTAFKSSDLTCCSHPRLLQNAHNGELSCCTFQAIQPLPPGSHPGKLFSFPPQHMKETKFLVQYGLSNYMKTYKPLLWNTKSYSKVWNASSISSYLHQINIQLNPRAAAFLLEWKFEATQRLHKNSSHQRMMWSPTHYIW